MPNRFHATAWDARTARRALAIAALAQLVAVLVTAVTDEGGLGWGVRAGRALPIAPVSAAVGTWLALQAGRARGDDRALAALGRSPWQRVAAAVAGGAAVALVAASLLGGVPAIDVAGFYPRIARDVRYHAVAGGAGAAGARVTFESDDGAWRIDEGGRPEPLTPAAPAPSPDPLGALPRHARGAAAAATAIAGIALPLLVARARRRTTALAALAVGITAVATILAFQAAATGRVVALLVTVPPILLLAAAAGSYGAWTSWWTARARRSPRRGAPTAESGRS